MTVEQFLHEVQEYYGYYGDTAKKYTTQWLRKWSAEDRRKIFAEVLKCYSNRWKIPPDVATLEEAERKVDRGHPDIDPLCEYQPLQIEEGEISNEEAQEYFREMKRIFHGLSRKKTEGVK